MLDGRIYDAHFAYTAGGVGRNICESLYKLGCSPNFITVVGDDEQGNLMKRSIPSACSHLLEVNRYFNTAQCTIIFDKKGDCKFLMGDMEIHRQITPEMIRTNEDIIKTSPLLILDANLTVEALEEALRLADKHKTPVFFEPTDLEISTKPFKTPYWKAIKYITPNLNELKHISNTLKIPIDGSFSTNIEEAAHISKHLLEYLDNVIVTLGPDGILIARRGLATENFFKSSQSSQKFVRHYSTKEIKNIVNVSGAGDCFASGFIAALIAGSPEQICVSVGFAAAKLALYSQAAVPKKIFDKNHESWHTLLPYKNII